MGTSVLPSLAGKPRNFELCDKVVTIIALSEHFKLRGSKIGYPGAINFYSIRRRAANDLTREIGRDAARSIMNHNAESRVLEKYYLDLGTEGYSHQIDNKQTLAASPYTATSADLKNFKRRIRRIALETLLNDETQKQRQQMMTLDFNERLKHLNYSKESDLTVNDKTQQIIHNIEEDGEEDLEAQHTDPNASIEIRRELDENDGNGDVNVDIEITYETAVRAFMQAMMENSLSQHKDMKNNPANCPLCQEDDTITNPR
ncbi:hypothetical protein FLAG1_06929 [Fusarium langsethiae]|uniref:Uncharacterized protein n=1 Tax=Fusarium langsethiae TaxID=179993 RepID=A0A0M9EUX7_FUSLA|nr:hypothetical protein FLAG1_06929 [Fusarium langsethiae]